MCTVTWRREANAYEVFFNRDEKRARAAAAPPAVFGPPDNPRIAALDGQAGGTWLAVSSRGLTVGLLNFYDGQCAPPPAQPRSRGRLVLELIDLPDASAVAQELEGLALACYPAFVLLALDPRGGIVARWDGRAARAEKLSAAHRPLTTSSFDPRAVVRERRRAYAETIGPGEPTADALERFHRGSHPRGGAYAVWMERPDARTVSFSRVRVGPDAVSFWYEPREGGRAVETSCPRRA